MAKTDDLAPIIDGCKAGSAEDFAKLVDIYSSRVYGYFYRLTGNRELCEELISELFFKLVGKIGSYKGGSFDSWLFKIATNIFHDYLRSKQRRKKLHEARKKQLQAEIKGPKRSDGERIDKLQVQLAKLNEETRELIMLRYYSQLSLKEVAKVRREPIGTTLSKLHRGIKRLRELME
jgi:RNA polymerase sigma-70 factor (ECF subfamily)